MRSLVHFVGHGVMPFHIVTTPVTLTLVMARTRWHLWRTQLHTVKWSLSSQISEVTKWRVTSAEYERAWDTYLKKARTNLAMTEPSR